MPDLGEVRIPCGCQLDGGFGRRLCVERYEDVMERVNGTTNPIEMLEFRVLSGKGPKASEVVRWSVERGQIGAVLEITNELEERWKEFEEEEAAAPMMISLGPGGLGGFRIG